MAQYLGIDVMSYPGDSTMAWLWAHGFRVTGFYLNHRRGGPEDNSWISHHPILANAGWGLAPLYLGWQTVDNQGNHLPAPSNPSGTAATDVTETVALMNTAGFAQGTVIYIDIEDGTVPSGDYDTYLSDWITGIRAQGFVPGVYCSHLCIAWATSKGVPIWSVHIGDNSGGPYDPGNLPITLDSGCIGTQFRQEKLLNGLPLQLDLDCFAVPDPSSGVAASQLVHG
jgi:Domain of unknown function (DUF1906)